MHWPEVPRMASAPSRVARLAEKPTDLGESQILDSRVRHGFGMEHTDVPAQRTVSPGASQKWAARLFCGPHEPARAPRKATDLK
jgi:hypothetical protein